MIGFYNYTILLTYLSVASAVFGMTEIIHGRPIIAVVCLMFSGLCDMFDGTVARMRQRTDVEKRFGIQIDSLADVIAFGVLPAMIGYSAGLNRGIFIVILVVFVLAALTRLAYFNVMEEIIQDKGERRTEYEGLPVTTVALIVPMIYGFKDYLGMRFPIVYAAALICISLAFLLKVKIKKLSAWSALIIIGVGLIELIWVLKK
ncbi:MAG: CDP-alcohol phosphatidyltransferase family protein [Clostridia bacterium]|nr:CDP-alcohol phosphatidyltransferase family protein [Clostridia bacterium]